MAAKKPKKQTGPLIIVKEDMFAEAEKMGKYKFGDKERERSNRAVGIQDRAYGTKRRCPLRHQRIACAVDGDQHPVPNPLRSSTGSHHTRDAVLSGRNGRVGQDSSRISHYGTRSRKEHCPWWGGCATH